MIIELYAKHIFKCFACDQMYLSQQPMRYMLLLSAWCGWGNWGKGNLRNVPRVPRLVNPKGTGSWPLASALITAPRCLVQAWSSQGQNIKLINSLWKTMSSQPTKPSFMLFSVAPNPDLSFRPVYFFLRLGRWGKKERIFQSWVFKQSNSIYYCIN